MATLVLDVDHPMMIDVSSDLWTPEQNRFSVISYGNWITETTMPDALKTPKTKKQSKERALHTVRNFGFIPYTYIEGMLYGPIYLEHIDEFREDILNAFAGQQEIQWIHPELAIREGRCTGVIIHMHHSFWTKRLKFLLPPIEPKEIVRVVWTAVEGAKSLPNVAPEMLAREILSRYGTSEATSQQ